MDTEAESVCCHEVDKLNRMREDRDCITSHEAFADVCLNVNSLAVAYYTINEYRPVLLEAPEIHREQSFK
ncbi:hypothetical protein HPB50_022131 [Hyalomma asiaticum]|uniref:Uncharacterized protein n=1 Tax=Hyalomma asiaticum TaxID=266040 RepID=A0ACB7TLU2_HYAAI|nr:hypothetical protein HPB50_022131 [Hyalomma asiaticum]